MNRTVNHNEEYQQFTIELGEEDAELAYARPEENVLDFTHTYVPESARGKGIAFVLIEAGIQHARENNCRVIATCPIVAKYFERHEEHQELLKNGKS